MGKSLYQWNCTNPSSQSECDFILDNSRSITFETLKKNVNSEDLLRVLNSWGFNTFAAVKKEYCLRFLKSKTTRGEPVYIFEHSCIDHMFF